MTAPPLSETQARQMWQSFRTITTQLKSGRSLLLFLTMQTAMNPKTGIGAISFRALAKASGLPLRTLPQLLDRLTRVGVIAPEVNNRSRNADMVRLYRFPLIAAEPRVQHLSLPASSADARRQLH